MKTLIVYSTSETCTTKTVNELARKLAGEIEKVDLQKDFYPILKSFDRIIIGGSIQSGHIDRRVTEFCHLFYEDLKNKEVGLFICCSDSPEVARHEIRYAFPEEIHQLAKTEAIFRSSLNFDDLNLIEKMMVKRIAKFRQSALKPDECSIEQFAIRMEKTYHPFMFLV